jgi:predicted acyl esterase
LRINDEAPVLAFVQGDGGWRATDDFPVPEVSWTTLRPQLDGLLGETAEDTVAEYEPTPLVGAASGQWDAMGTGMGYPLDQGPDDRQSLCYELSLEDAWEVCGSPEAVLDVQRLDEGDAFLLVAKLVDVAPDGSGELITSGWAQTQGGPTRVPLWATAFRLAPGHRLRLSVSCADFPRAWPDIVPQCVRLNHARSELRLPLAPGGIGTPAQPRRAAPVPATERFPWTRSGAPVWKMERDLANEAVSVTLGGSETLALPQGGTLAIRQSATARVSAGHPANASVRAEAAIDIDTDEGEHIEVRSRSRIWRDRDVFWGSVSVDGCPVFERSWRSAS